MSVLYTVGYEGTDIDRFVKTLQHAGIRRVIDVRAVPVSRKKGFSKTKLSERLRQGGIEYTHLVKLGDPKPGRDAARAGDFATFRKIYGKHFKTDDAQRQFAEMTSLALAEPVCLLCFERDPKTCHRTIVAKRLAREQSFEIFNLFADDPERYVRYASKMPSYNPREGAAAA